MSNKAEDIIQGYETLKSQRSTVDNVYRDIERLILPNYQGSEHKLADNEGNRKQPISNIATDAAILLGSNLYSYTYSTTDRNFILKSNEPTQSDNTNRWLQKASDTALKYLQTSNISSVYGEFCQALTTFGTAVASVEFDADNYELIFKHHPITGEVCIIEGPDGRVDGIMRKLKLSARQALAMFGEEGLCDRAKEALTNLSLINEKFEYVLSVQSNPKQNPEKIGIQYAKYTSDYVCCVDKRIVKSSGYKTFPYIVARWIKSYDGSPYGIGSGSVALPAVRKINDSEAELHDAFAMAARPPVFVNDDGVIEIDEIKPGTVIYTDLTQANPTQLNIHSRPDVIMARIQQLTEQISKSFFNHVFLSVNSSSGGPRTATEIDAIQSEKLQSLTPLVANLRSEFWAPMVERIIYLLLDNGLIEKPDAETMGKGYRIEYVSQLDARLSVIEANKTLMALRGAAEILATAAQAPDIDKVFKAVEAAKRHLEASNVDFDLIVSDVERREMDEVELQAAIEQQAQQAQEQILNKMGNVDPNKKPETGSVADTLGQTIL